MNKIMQYVVGAVIVAVLGGGIKLLNDVSIIRNDIGYITSAISETKADTRSNKLKIEELDKRVLILEK